MRRFGAALEADARPWAADPAEVRGGAQIVDVRRAANYAQSADRIAGAVWRDPVALEAWSRELDSTRPVLVYCVHGHEVSRAAALALRARGLDARFIAGGIEACRAAGIALEVKE
ncbi:TPA: sulfurtransferase [Pseudomonas aeruginosa]|nr:sulfurtransferase [Pseudomonas aeruginosa]HCR1518709.1 sulfurtransferase [Pseudomonas aeruginosa]